MSVEVSTPVFEGPFDLLLDLILRERVDLYEVSLSAVTDRFVAELDRIEALDLEVTTEFLMIAAVLVELKTKRLLPNPTDIDLDDELGLWSERDLLLSRLIECKTFKDAGRALARLVESGSRVAPRRAGPEEAHQHLAPDVLEGVTALDLRRAFLRATAPKPVQHVDLHHVTISKASVADAIVELLDELPRARRLSFRAICAQLVDRIEIVVRFLAVLELYKQGVVDLDQPERFGDIAIRWTGDAADVAEVAAAAAEEVYAG